MSFFKHSTTVVAEPKALLVNPPAKDVLDSAERAAKSAEIPLCADLIRGFFLNYLAENDISIYKESDVLEYLESICPRKVELTWLPTSKIDDCWFVNRSIYPLPIPIRTMNLIAKIREEFKYRTYFMVSYFSDPKLDPFLCVRVGGVMHYIDCWDEPQFTAIHG